MRQAKRLLAAVIAAAFVVVAAPTAHASASDDRLFVKLLRKEAPAFRAIAPRELVAVAKETCAVMDMGFTILDVVEIGTDSGFTEKQAIALVASSIVFYCPRHKNNY
jgi:hypothetical protein